MAKINSLIINIFICACAFVVVHGEDFDWIPATVLTPTEQCKQANEQHRGSCSMRRSQPYICQNLHCAIPAQYGTHLRLSLATAKDGTICGESHVCRGDKCMKVPTDKLPKEEGSKQVFRCEFL